jgi:hypothetical protein
LREINYKRTIALGSQEFWESFIDFWETFEGNGELGNGGENHGETVLGFVGFTDCGDVEMEVPLAFFLGVFKRFYIGFWWIFGFFL